MSFNRPIIYRDENKRFEVRGKDRDDPVEYITTAQLAAGAGIGNMSTCVFRGSAIRRLDEAFWSLGTADWGYALALGQFGLIARLPGSMSVYRVHAGGLYSGRPKADAERRTVDRLEKWDQYLGHRFSREFEINRRRAGLRNLRRTWRRAVRNALRRLFGLSGRKQG